MPKNKNNIYMDLNFKQKIRNEEKKISTLKKRNGKLFYDLIKNKKNNMPKIFKNRNLIRKLDHNINEIKFLNNGKKELKKIRKLNENSGNFIEAVPSYEIENFFDGIETYSKYDLLLTNAKLKFLNSYDVLFLEIKNIYKNLKSNIMNIKLQFAYCVVDFKKINFKYIELNNINDLTFNDFKTLIEDKTTFPSIEMNFIITGILMSYFNPVEKSLKSFVKRLHAFAPCQNRKFYELTSISTTTNRLCIWETYYYLYVENINLKKNHEKIANKLNEESKEIIKFVKNGELINFLLEKSKETKEIFYIEFFKKFAIKGLEINYYDDDQIKELKESQLLNEKVFLYDELHVAPRKKMLTNNQEKTMIKKIEKLKIDNAEHYLNEDELKNVALKDHYRILNNNKNKYEFSLKKLKNFKSQEIKEVIGFDFETYNDDLHIAQPFCLCLSNGKTFYGERKQVVDEFINYLESICHKTDISKTKEKKKVPQIYFYGFNSSRFDNMFIFQELIERNPTMKYLICDNSIKYMRYFNIHFFDMSLFYSGSLKSVAKDFKLDISKSVFPYSFPNKNNLNYDGDVPILKYWNNEKDRNKYIENNGNTFNLKNYTIKYCLLDSKLVYEIAIKHLNNCIGKIGNKSFDVRNAKTAAALSLKFYSQIFQEETIFQSPNKIINFERESFKGGRTEVFKKQFKGNNNKKLYYFDINSSYPNSMLSIMPFKYVKKMSMNRVLTDDLIYDHHLYLITSKYKGNNKYYIPNLLVRSDKNDIIAVKNITEKSWQWGVELRQALKNDNEIYCYDFIIYEGKEIFKNYIEYLYNERLNAKKNNNDALSSFIKLLMNSLYGKFAQKTKQHCMLIKKMEDKSFIFNNEKIKFSSFDILENGNEIIKYTKIDDVNKSIGNLCRLSSYITAQSRTNLAKIMDNVGHENIYYCDTDSIFTDKMPSSEFLDNEKLGKFKLEEKKNIKLIEKNENGKRIKIKLPIICNNAIFLAPKTYNYEIELPEKYKDKIYSKTYEMKAKGHKSTDLKKNYYEAVLNGEKINIVNEAMFFRKIDSIKIMEQSRALNTTYNKRIWNGNESYAYDNYNDWHMNKYQK